MILKVIIIVGLVGAAFLLFVSYVVVRFIIADWKQTHGRSEYE